MSYALDVKNCCVINVEYYTGVNERLDVPIILPPALTLVDLQDARLLVVDDVADTGGTLELVARTIRPHVAELRTAVLYEKPHSQVKCDYVWRRTDRWIEFPGRLCPPSTTRKRRALLPETPRSCRRAQANGTPTPSTSGG